MKKFTFPKDLETTDDKIRFLVAFFRNTWMWGAPAGLSDRAEEFHQFLEETESIQYIKATRVIRINDIDGEDAVRLLGFLRNQAVVF